MDEAALLARVEGDRRLMRELVDIFTVECPVLIKAIESAVHAGDAKALEIAAHTLKGMVGNFSAKQAFEGALQLERLARARQMAEAHLAFRNLELHIARLKSALAALVTNRTAC